MAITISINDPERRKAWADIVDPDEIPIMAPFVEPAELAGLEGVQFVYYLDVRKLTDRQHQALLQSLKERFQLSDEEFKEARLGPIPILARNTSVTISGDDIRWILDDDDDDAWGDQYGDEESEYLREERRMEEAMEECGKTRDGYCMLAGTEHCDFECPFSH